jgi:hypothetical protein
MSVRALFAERQPLPLTMHGSATSRDRSLKGWKGMRSAGQRPEFGNRNTVSTKPNAPRDRYPPASRRVALFRPYRDPDSSVSGRPQRSKRTGLQPDTPLCLQPRRRRAGEPSKPIPGPSEYPPRTQPRSITPRRRNRSLAMRPFLATRWRENTAGFEAGDGGRRMLVSHPSPLAGEGGRRGRSDEGSHGANRSRRKANPTGLSPPHPAPRATFSRRGRRKSARTPTGIHPCGFSFNGSPAATK